MTKWIYDIIEEKKQLLVQLEKIAYWKQVEYIGRQIVTALRNGNKVILAGNGGSAADAQHFAAELVGRFLIERKALPAISLCTDPSIMTCIANDYGYEKSFSRQIQALGQSGDVFIGFSTSGNSENMYQAILQAKCMNILTIGVLGKDGGKMKAICNEALIVPSNNTPRIQEIHEFTVHLLCEFIEHDIFVTEED